MSKSNAFATALLALALLAIAMPEGLHAAFTEKVSVQAFDQNLRPIEGVETYIDYQLNSITTLARTKSKFTDQNGIANLTFTNWEEIEGDKSKSYTLYLKYGSQLYSYGMISNGDNKTRKVSQTDLKSYLLQAKIHDQNNRALQAKLTINNRTKNAEGSGLASFQLPPGKFNLRAEIATAVKNRNITVDRDQAVDIEIGLYNLEVRVSDDRRNPLAAKVQVEGRENATNSSGRVSFSNLTEQSETIIVQSNDSTKKYNVDLSRQSLLEVVFDRTKPLIKELHVTPLKTGAATARLYIEDPGDGASGVDTVIVTYEVDGVENQVPAYSIGYNTYEVKIPIQPPKTLVKYVVRVTDREGNGAFETGNYVVGGEEGGQTITPAEPVTSGQVQIGFFKGGIETVVIGVAVAAVLLFGIFQYLKFKKKEKEPDGFAPKPPEIPKGEA